MIELWSHWAPPLERTKILGIVYSGNHWGTFLTMAMSGVIAENLGWPWMFYIFGIHPSLFSYEKSLKYAGQAFKIILIRRNWSVMVRCLDVASI